MTAFTSGLRSSASNEWTTDIRFIRGRLHFSDSKNAAPFPSAIVVFERWA